jgi:hypothetical protein
VALIRSRVDPPAANRPLYGLLDVAAEQNPDSGKWRTGVEYDTFACHEAKVWGEWCQGSGQPTGETITRTISVTLTGTRTGAAEPFEYGLTFTAAVDGGPIRQIQVRVETQTDSYSAVAPTGAAATPVVTSADAPLVATATITDLVTGTTIAVAVEQNVDGTLVEPVAPLVIAVPEQAVPDGCFGITTVLTAAPAATGGGAAVSAVATTTGGDNRQLLVYIGSTRTVLTAGAGTSTLVENLAPGIYRIGIRDVESWSFVSGWLYIGDDFTGTATFVQATCAVKDISTPPWQTITADPFTIYAEVICSTMAFDEAAPWAAQALQLSAGRTIERHYWESLIQRGQQLAAGNAVDPVRALAELEQYIASVYNGMGIIHTSPWGVAYLSNAGLLDDTADGDERLRTWRGTPVIVGHGYPREGTDTAATGADFWMFITGAISIITATDDPIEVVDKERNDRFAVAEQTVVVLDDCPVPGVVHVTAVVL